ncbi:mycofactocin dehydrogenase MftG [Amycolatopsis pithecellobii]|uniref:Mycofactocin system GMC family oxidoreductase MftG n=1 Tax=Amycolatopsis pithecellobii TaxID=664692 RepID=A0A6N7YXA0_9PSEU|nr:mycofactocin system GMC family oxidoreductase MftG [Amycolatopsis pithecellobii]MTD56508.1 mycofactocin system GMC family oxidoreductase MftG [Amycolatopsis pithecellobii]
MHDVIVVGAGSAGSVLAMRLSEDPNCRVLVIEAGDVPTSEDLFPTAARFSANREATTVPNHPNTWSYELSITSDRRWKTPRGKILGGSSAINGSYFVRGVPADFDEWAALGLDGWSYEDVLPSFRAIETDQDFDTHAHGTAGPIEVRRAANELLSPLSVGFLEACERSGFPVEPDKNAGSAPGAGLLPGNVTLEGFRSQPGVRCIVPHLGRSNLTVMGNTQVQRILFDGQRAVGVEAVGPAGDRTNFMADEVVLSAGPFNSPHLLMVSGVGPADMLRRAGIEIVQDMPGVGRDWFDDPCIWVPYRPTPELAIHRQEMFAPQAALNFDSGNAPAGDLEVILFAQPMGALGHAMCVILHREDSRGSMEIVSPDPGVPLRLAYNFGSAGRDIERLASAVATCLDIMHQSPFHDQIEEIAPHISQFYKDDTGLTTWVRDVFGATAHTAGSLSMGKSTSESTVVDRNLRVHGLENLRVADASVFPTPLHRGPFATTMMIGQKAAGLICDGDEKSSRQSAEGYLLASNGGVADGR